MILKEIIEDTQSLSELSRDELSEVFKLLDTFIKQHFWLPSRVHPGRDYSIFFPKELDEIIPRFSSELGKAFKAWLDGTIRRLSATRYKSMPILKQLDFEAIEVVEVEKLRDALYEIILSGIREAAEAGNSKAIANIELVSKGAALTDYSKSFELSPQLITQLKTTSRALANRLGNDLADKVQFQILEGVRRREGFPEIRRRVMMELSKRDLLVEDLDKNLNRFKNYEDAIAALGSKWNFPESWGEKLKDAYEVTESAAAAIDGTGFVSNLYSRKAELIARTETIRAMSEASLERYEESKVVQMVEFEATGDERLCEECASLNGKRFTLDESHGIIPVHHSCRCVFIPVLKD